MVQCVVIFYCTNQDARHAKKKYLRATNAYVEKPDEF